MAHANNFRLSPNLRVVLSLGLGVRIEWHIGDVVRKLREAKRWNQLRLAEVAGLNKGTIVSVEEGANVKVETMQAVAKGLGLTMAQLYTLLPATGEETAQAPAVAGESFRPTGTAGAEGHGPSTPKDR